jgi:hypothetical protein
MSDYFTLNFAKNIAKIEDATGDFLTKNPDVAIDSDKLYSGDWELSVRTQFMTNINDIKRMPVQVQVIVKHGGRVAASYYSDGVEDTAEVVLWWVRMIAKASDKGYKARRETENDAAEKWIGLED